MRPLRRGLVAACAALLLVLASSCTWAQNQPDHPERKAFTVGVTEKFNRLDPAADGSGLSDAMVLASFQRLLALDPDGGLLKPDAGSCMFLDELTYQCEVSDELYFTDGAAVTAPSVKFSIDRAIALDRSGEAAVLFAALDEIEVLDDSMLLFHLDRVDNQFGYALAAPLASIVSPNAYSPDRIRPASQLAVGSGPYEMQIITETRVGFTAYSEYDGFADPGQQRLNIQRYDSPEIVRTAMSNREVDIAWGGLDSQQVAALDVQVEASALGTTRDGFRRLTDPGGRAWQLNWSAESRWFTDDGVRERVAAAIARVRTDRSLIPPGEPGWVPAFADTAQVETGEPLRLSIGFDSSVADEPIRAERLRAALGGAGIEVELVPDGISTDLWLGENRPPTDSATGWLMNWLENPLPGTEERNAEALAAYESADEQTEKDETLGTLQELAAEDLTVLPLWREDRVTWMGPGISTSDREYLGPGGQLAVWGFHW